jgi:hypothetical protein
MIDKWKHSSDLLHKALDSAYLDLVSHVILKTIP